MKVKYVGGIDAIDTVVDGKVVTVNRGEEIEVSDRQGSRLLEQEGNWQTPERAPKPEKAGNK